jgi:hypothetical protein
MKKLVTLLLSFVVAVALVLPAEAVEDGQVMYVGGTVPALSTGLIGRLDTTSEASLTFEAASSKLVIPYAKITSYEYSTEVTHHLGVLGAMAVGLLKKRQRQHFFRISYFDAGNVPQVAVFEVSKHMPRTLQAVLETRGPQKCKIPLRCSD